MSQRPRLLGHFFCTQNSRNPQTFASCFALAAIWDAITRDAAITHEFTMRACVLLPLAPYEWRPKGSWILCEI